MATIKQQTVVKDILENPGKPVSQAMLDAGYSPAHAKNPQDLTESKGWKQLLDEYLPDSLLAAVHTEGLQATKIHTSHTEPDREIADYPTRKSYLELAYKVKGKLGADTQINNQFNSDTMNLTFTKDDSKTP